MLIPQRGRKFSIGMTRWCPDKDRKSTRLNSSHTVIYTLSLHDALPILAPFVLAAVVLGAGGYALYRLGVDQGMKVAGSVTSASSAATGAPQKAGDVDPTTGKKVLYWHDPMVPGQKFDKPGKSPFMDMQLVPMYADSDTDAGRVAISSRVQQNLGVRTAPVKQGPRN